MAEWQCNGAFVCEEDFKVLIVEFDIENLMQTSF